MKIFLWGFMGCGKSFLRQKLGHPGFDCDEELLRRYGQAGEGMASLINRLGWQEFRQKEYELFQELVLGDQSGVFSLGGGCLTEDRFDWNWPDGEEQLLVWINTSPENCWDRVKNHGERPLVLAGQKAFYELYEDRKQLYQKAHYCSDDEEEIGQFVSDALSRKLKN